MVDNEAEINRLKRQKQIEDSIVLMVETIKTKSGRTCAEIHYNPIDYKDYFGCYGENVHSITIAGIDIKLVSNPKVFKGTLQTLDIK